VGSFHTSQETPRVEQAKHQALDWSMLRVLTRLSLDELDARNIGAGTRVVVARSRKELFMLGDCVCGYALDDKAALAVMLETMRMLQEQRPAGDVYFVATSAEEQDGCGATFATEHLKATTALALEIGPVSEEYGLVLDHRPIIWYRDSTANYTKSFCDELAGLGKKLGFGAQRAVYDEAGSDASCSRSAGHVGRVAVLAFPGINSHGFEVAPVAGILNMQQLLFTYLTSGA
jgi:putative aminopeptidase FrvX